MLSEFYMRCIYHSFFCEADIQHLLLSSYVHVHGLRYRPEEINISAYLPLEIENLISNRRDWSAEFDISTITNVKTCFLKGHFILTCRYDVDPPIGETGVSWSAGQFDPGPISLN